MDTITVDDPQQTNCMAFAGLEESVKSLAVIKEGHIRATLHDHSDKAHDSLSQTFLVTDLITKVSYAVSQFGSRTQLLVPLEDRVIVAEVDSHADFSAIAAMLTNRPMT